MFEAAKNDASMTSESPEYMVLKTALAGAEDLMRAVKGNLDHLGKQKAEQDAVDYEVAQREARAEANTAAEAIKTGKANAMQGALTAFNNAEAAKALK